MKAGDVFGAFADCAILFPLIVSLTLINGFSATTLLLTTGLFYILAGIFYKIPMSIQPLKSIVIAGIAFGASASEIRISGAILGILCLIILFFDVDKWAKKFPTSLIHGLQVGLAILLITQGLKATNVSVIFLSMALVLLTKKIKFPFLGLLATLVLLWSFFHQQNATSPTQINTNLRLDLILTLVLPQLALTLTNSVLATKVATERYFNEKANKVTYRNLLFGIGMGNVLGSLVGAMPFCHGSGGITAHYQGGARSFRMNFVIGITLLIFAAFSYMSGNFHLQIPPLFLGMLLMTTGIFHLELALPTWKNENGKILLVIMAIATVLTKNLLIALLFGFLYLSVQNIYVRHSLRKS